MDRVEEEHAVAGERGVIGERRLNGEQQLTAEHGMIGAQRAAADEPYVVGPDGERMTRADLPDANTRRWVPRRKARIVAAVEGGLISREWALERYRLTPEEFDSWRAAMSRFGTRGLCVTKMHERRSTSR